MISFLFLKQLNASYICSSDGKELILFYVIKSLLAMTHMTYAMLYIILFV